MNGGQTYSAEVFLCTCLHMFDWHWLLNVYKGAVTAGMPCVIVWTLMSIINLLFCFSQLWSSGLLLPVTTDSKFNLNFANTSNCRVRKVERSLDLKCFAIMNNGTERPISTDKIVHSVSCIEWPMWWRYALTPVSNYIKCKYKNCKSLAAFLLIKATFSTKSSRLPLVQWVKIAFSSFSWRQNI